MHIHDTLTGLAVTILSTFLLCHPTFSEEMFSLSCSGTRSYVWPDPQNNTSSTESFTITFDPDGGTWYFLNYSGSLTVSSWKLVLDQFPPGMADMGCSGAPAQISRSSGALSYRLQCPSSNIQSVTADVTGLLDCYKTRLMAPPSKRF